MEDREEKEAAQAELRCGNEDHDNQRKSDKTKKRQLAKFIIARMLTFSKNTSIIVGPERQISNVPQDLLALHSTFFREHFDRAEQEIVLPTMRAAEFAKFVAWLHLLVLDSEPLYGDEEDLDTVTERGWELGRILGAPGYQNSYMLVYKDYCRDNLVIWPDALTIRTIYDITPPRCKLRKFAADSMAARSPFKRYAAGSRKLAEWDALLKEFPELSIDIVYASVNDWRENVPWDDEYLVAYMEDEVSLDSAWEEQILAKRNIDEIRKEAEKKCIRSIFELSHLERNKNRE
ncbi:hypothetical protein ONS95_011704 [Cadophora gregata]|uniref:uncharacterized protein n=1 Tax=Cadophora gregata TaxID=51156 RepID=UPI0026DD833D|nr:uncharacterized protein ONS95_011704 [Cadophora gregata]KAK0120298.1 hypothetical protein ONS95_011704 [Cadophora gregata]KAK0121331.1 hypothetical protein ONS96_011506 [Cadophora gregata f. sp. sojae]